MRLHKSTEHQLWRVTLIVGVSNHSVTESGLDCVLDALNMHSSLIVVASDEDKLTTMSEASWQAMTRDPFAPALATIVAGDETDDDLFAQFIDGTPQHAKRIRGKARKASERWSKLDLATVKQMRKQGRSIEEIADRVGRTPASVRNQIQQQKGK